MGKGTGSSLHPVAILGYAVPRVVVGRRLCWEALPLSVVGVPLVEVGTVPAEQASLVGLQDRV